MMMIRVNIRLVILVSGSLCVHVMICIERL